MKQAVAGEPIENFPVPEGIVFVKVDAANGEPLGPANQPKSIKVLSECFKEGTAPPGPLESKTR
jgi:penicillin-binding protein 1A